MERKKTYNFEKFYLHVLLFLLFNDTVVGQTQSKWKGIKKSFDCSFCGFLACGIGRRYKKRFPVSLDFP